MSRCRSIIACVLIMWAAGCNERNAVLDTAAASPSTGPTSVVPANASTLSLSFTPPAVMGGGGSVGSVLLSRPAPADGMVVALSAPEAAVTVPSSVVVPAGTRRADFSMATRTTATDVRVLISASASGASVQGAFWIWAVLPTFFSVVTDEGSFIASSGFRRFTPENATFTGRCSQNRVSIFARSGLQSWSSSFSPRVGLPLRPGTYESATRIATVTQPGLDVAGDGGCNSATGRFVLHEVDLTANGIIRRFWATFEQRCTGDTAAIRGDVRATDIPIGDTTVSTCTIR